MAAPKMVYGVPMISFAGDGFCLLHPMDLIVKRKRHGLSNISYEVSDGNGNLFLLVDGSYMTLYRKRVMRNTAGFPILTIHEKPMKTRLEVFLAGNMDKDISNFQVVGSNYPSQYYRVYKGDAIIAEAKKIISGLEFIQGWIMHSLQH
ncbi:hypothetical protein V6N12_045260 [Hibiscus sabdariffa]|uniref:Uncharacterized protein n=1 Tax=Hibiscus sabdariffa TaxID=183260 RepID=A0ABR2G280_9ROSI